MAVLQNVQTSPGAQSISYSSYPKTVTFPTHLHLLPSLRMGGAVPPLPLNAFMVGIGKNLTSLSILVVRRTVTHVLFMRSGLNSVAALRRM